jgi:hypothetical protein
MLDLEAYAADCRLHGRVELGDVRLTDMLNATRELRVVDARLEDLADGHVAEVPELTVMRDELCGVVANEARGEPARRLRTITTRVQTDLGPYHVEGDAHGTPASDPLHVALRRAAWVSLTDVTITYRRGADMVRDEVATLLVNRDVASTFQAVEPVSVALPWEASGAPRPAAARALDLTGTIGEELGLAPDDAPDDATASPPPEPHPGPQL